MNILTKRRLITAAVCNINNFALKALNGLLKCTNIFCDLSKAFDCIRNKILKHTLEYQDCMYSIDTLLSFLKNNN